MVLAFIMHLTGILYVLLFQWIDGPEIYDDYLLSPDIGILLGPWPAETWTRLVRPAPSPPAVWKLDTTTPKAPPMVW